MTRVKSFAGRGGPAVPVFWHEDFSCQGGVRPVPGIPYLPDFKGAAVVSREVAAAVVQFLHERGDVSFFLVMRIIKIAVTTSSVISEATSGTASDHLDLIQAVAAEVPADLPYVRFHVAKLFVSMLLFRLGLSADQVAGFFPGVDLGQLSMEYSGLLDGDRMGTWFLVALDRFEPDARRCLDLSPSGAAPAVPSA